MSFLIRQSRCQRSLTMHINLTKSKTYYNASFIVKWPLSTTGFDSSALAQEKSRPSARLKLRFKRFNSSYKSTIFTLHRAVCFTSRFKAETTNGERNRRVGGNGNQQNCRSNGGIYFYNFSDTCRKLLDLRFCYQISSSSYKHEFYFGELGVDRLKHGAYYDLKCGYNCHGEVDFWWLVL